MLTLTISLDSLALYLVAADILILLSYILFIKHRSRQHTKAVKRISAFITEYFGNSGGEVQVTCYRLKADNHFVALIESEPLKRFRCSNILESYLINHIFKYTGYVVEEIYWRFPIQLSAETVIPPQGNSQENDDLYISEGYAIAQAQGDYKVSEVTWEQFENAKGA